MPSDDKIQQYIDKIRSSNPVQRGKAIQKISQICSLIGTERTIYELIPYIVESCCFNENDLVCIVRQLAMLDFSQMDSSDIYKLLLKMKFFAEISSKLVRKEFIKLVKRISNCTSEFSQLIVWYISELFAEVWYVFHLTGIGLMRKFKNRIQRKDFNELKVKVSSILDDEIMDLVLEYIRMCEKCIDILDDDILNQIDEFSNHKSMSVLCEIPKFYAIYAAKKGSEDKMFQKSLVFWNNCNWRIRYSFVNAMKDYLKLKNPPFEDIFDVIYEILLDQGEEEEIKLFVTDLLNDLANYKNINKEKLITIINNLSIEQNKDFKLSLTNFIINYKNILDIKYIKSTLLKLISDESQEVKSSAFQSLNSLNLMDEKLLKDFIKKNYNWREKKNIPILLTKLKDLSNLKEILLVLLQDDSYEIRKETINILPKIISTYGKNVITSIIMPVVIEISKSSDYKLRQTAIMSVVKIEFYKENGLKLLRDALNDDISNVRLTLALYVDRSLHDIVSKLQEDKDEEVKEAAMQPPVNICE